MKYVAFNKHDQPIYYINNNFEFFYFSSRKRLSDEEQAILTSEIADWTLPDFVCMHRKTGEKTSSRLLYEQSLKTDLDDPETQLWIDQKRLDRYNEATIADELGISTKTLQRRYPKATKHSWSH